MTFQSIATVIFIVLNLTTCMRIYNKIGYNKYCPKNNTCQPPESHLECKYFEHVKKSNAICVNYTRINITHLDVERILEKVNKVRAAVANGKESGKDGERFPRGYGMFRLHWDSELAGLSDLFLRNGDSTAWFVCAATGKFVKPMISGISHPLTPDLDIIEKVFDGWENRKKNTTVANILECPDLSSTSSFKYYLRMVQGPATHMGCASALCDKSTSDKRKMNRFICYFSYWTPLSAPVYTMDRPVPGAGLTSRCGCPPGYWEDSDCLCERLNLQTTSTALYYYQQKYLTRNADASAATTAE